MSQNQTASIAVQDGLASYTTVPGRLVNLVPGSLAYSSSITGATCLGFTYQAGAPIEGLLSTAADFEDSFDNFTVSF